MKEEDYILVSNLRDLVHATTLIRGVITGPKYGVTQEERARLLEMLDVVNSRLLEVVKIDGDAE